MIQKITLLIDGQEKTFQKLVTARMCRTAYDARLAYIDSFKKAKDGITPKMIDELTAWIVEAYDGQFTVDQFLDGYPGSFLEIRDMMDEIITAASDAMVEFPKRTPEAIAEN